MRQKYLENNEKTNDLIKSQLEIWMEYLDENPKMFVGLEETLKPLYDYDYWGDVIDYVIEDLIDLEDEDDDGEFVFCDKIDIEVVKVFGERLFNNLKSMGFEYTNCEEDWKVGGRWNIDSKLFEKWNGDGLTNYGLVWEFMSHLDTSMREWCSDILSEIFNELQTK